MNHPTREEWMSYLYGELNRAQRDRLAAHLQVCPDCGAQVNEWRAARDQLDAWQFHARRLEPPAKPARQTPALPLFKWATATVLVLGIGFSFGRLTSAPADVEQVRAAIEPALRQQLRRDFTELLRQQLSQTASATLTDSAEQTEELLSDYAAALEAKYAEDHRAVYAALGKLASQHDADYLSLKNELDTVALNTDAGLREAEQQLVQLADFTQPSRTSNSPEK